VTLSLALFFSLALAIHLSQIRAFLALIYALLNFPPGAIMSLELLPLKSDSTSRYPLSLKFAAGVVAGALVVFGTCFTNEVTGGALFATVPRAVTVAPRPNVVMYAVPEV
jgi:hypothetical protein